MKRLAVKIVLLVLLSVLFPACTVGCGSVKKTPGPCAKVSGKSFLLKDSSGAYAPVFLNGVNMGTAIPGTFPGELAVTKEEYLRWFQEIADMNVTTVRVYTLQMPDFYDALLEHNQKASRPLNLIQGIYLNEDTISKDNDALSAVSGLQGSFLADIKNGVDIIHGHAQIARQNGTAGGTYTSDVSPYTIAWILGIEWSADFVINTNTLHPDAASYDGSYVYTENASPFEVFLARAADEAVTDDMKNYEDQRPVALCNWATTDPLSHPNEPVPEMEDAVSVDAEHIKAKPSFEAGFFASYHVYPYYPEFMGCDTKYLTGNPQDPYLAYLKELNSYHTMPVLISEYGIPSSRGIAHRNPVTGMTQGNASESTQAEWLISMNRDIKSAGCMGGLIFSWQDEWFKRTWNTMDFENSDRRPYWYNTESPEECFGLLAFDPGEKSTAAVVDGDASEWNGTEPLVQNRDLSLSVRYDSAYVYLLIRSSSLNFDTDRIYIPIDTIPDQGNTADNHTGLSFGRGADFLLTVGGKDGTSLQNDIYYDAFQYTYAEHNTLLPFLDGETTKNSGIFSPIYLALNKPLTFPETGKTTEFEKSDTGKFIYGNADPASTDYNSLADFAAGSGTVEVRIPWALLNVSDPSSKQILADFHTNENYAKQNADGFYFGICKEGYEGIVSMMHWDWDSWQLPATHERLKQSYTILQKYFAGG